MPSSEYLDQYYKTAWLNDEEIISTNGGVFLTYPIQAEEHVKYLSRHISITNDFKALDIGSGYGYLRDALIHRGYADISSYATYLWRVSVNGSLNMKKLTMTVFY